MIKNVHYLRNLNDEIINELICHLDMKRYAEGSIILKSGDVCNVSASYNKTDKYDIFLRN